MTKAEELKLLGKIEELIKSADEYSYIRMTFAGIVDICKCNIENDFGDSPVEDCANMRIAFDAECRRHDETKRLLAEAQGKLAEAIRDMDGMQKQVAELTEQRDVLAECVDGSNAIIDDAEAEIRKLKAEIVRMRMERMTDDAIAEMYDRMEGEFDD